MVPRAVFVFFALGLALFMASVVLPLLGLAAMVVA
jgi:hypothetical protein